MPRIGKEASISARNVLLLVCVAGLGVYLTLLQKLYIRQDFTSTAGDGGGPQSKTIQQLQERIRYLETKVDSYMAFASDPFLSMKASTKCKDQRYVKEIACPDKGKCDLDTSVICLDDLPYKVGDDERKKDCVVYDFGIRQSPEFGLAFAKQCDVVGFDPSPISVEWWKKRNTKIRREYPNYSFWGIGAGGIDGKIELREYDWGQVSIIEFPQRVINTTNCRGDGKCKFNFHKQQKSFKVPVMKLSSILKEQKQERVHLLKLDVEGSEYSFLETMIDDLSCRKIDQLVLEWHHYDHDVRYGVTSNPQINVLVALLKDRCGLEQFWVHGSKGWPSNEKLYAEMGMTLYYTLSSFRRTKWKFTQQSRTPK